MKTLQSAITLYIILLITNNLFGQNLDVYSGLTTNTFHGSDKDPHNYAKYETGLGYNFGIGYEKVKANRLLLRLTLSYDTYKGKLEAGNSGLGSGNITNANVKKSVLSFGFYPINFTKIKNLDMNIGLVVSTLLAESFTGSISYWVLGQPSSSTNLNDNFKRYSTSNTFGLSTRLAYKFNLTKLITISPQYFFYFGFSKELKEFPTFTKSIRNDIGVCVRFRL